MDAENFEPPTLEEVVTAGTILSTMSQFCAWCHGAPRPRRPCNKETVVPVVDLQLVEHVPEDHIGRNRRQVLDIQIF